MDQQNFAETDDQRYIMYFICALLSFYIAAMFENMVASYYFISIYCLQECIENVQRSIVCLHKNIVVLHCKLRKLLALIGIYRKWRKICWAKLSHFSWFLEVPRKFSHEYKPLSVNNEQLWPRQHENISVKTLMALKP